MINDTPFPCVWMALMDSNNKEFFNDFFNCADCAGFSFEVLANGSERKYSIYDTSVQYYMHAFLKLNDSRVCLGFFKSYEIFNHSMGGDVC